MRSAWTGWSPGQCSFCMYLGRINSSHCQDSSLLPLSFFCKCKEWEEFSVNVWEWEVFSVNVKNVLRMGF